MWPPESPARDIPTVGLSCNASFLFRYLLGMSAHVKDGTIFTSCNDIKLVKMCTFFGFQKESLFFRTWTTLIDKTGAVYLEWNVTFGIQAIWLASRRRNNGVLCGSKSGDVRLIRICLISVIWKTNIIRENGMSIEEMGCCGAYCRTCRVLKENMCRSCKLG